MVCVYLSKRGIASIVKHSQDDLKVLVNDLTAARDVIRLLAATRPEYITGKRGVISMWSADGKVTTYKRIEVSDAD
jgi:hypothetical protein